MYICIFSKEMPIFVQYEIITWHINGLKKTDLVNLNETWYDTVNIYIIFPFFMLNDKP